MTKIIDLHISNVAYKGKGIGHHQKKIIFVQNAIQQDHLKVKITKDKPNYSEAEKILNLSTNPLRQKKSCPYADKCGGCHWSDVNNEHQLTLKKTFIKDSLSRITKLEMTDHPITMHASPNTIHYRNRITLRGRLLKNGSLTLGFFKQNSRELVIINTCQITHHSLNHIIAQTEKIQLEEQKTTIPFRLELQVLDYEKGQNCPHIYAIFHSINNARKLDSLIEAVKQLPSILWAGYDYQRNKAPIAIFEEDKNLTYYTSPGVFQQVNSPHNKNLRAHINNWIEQISPSNILDLYCGSGNMSLSLANGKRTILGVEINKESIQLAKLNVKKNNLQNISYLENSVTNYLKAEAQKNSSFSCIILDPPRKGAKEDLDAIIQLSPTHIIYISCNPTTCARDLLSLIKHYTVIDVAGFDFFPDTYHIETVVILRKKA